MTHVALNLLYLDPGKTGGMETVARHLIPDLLEALPAGWQLTCLLNRNAAGDRSGPWHRSATHTIDVDVASRPAWVRAEMLSVPRAAGQLGADLLHSFGNMGPWRTRLPHLLTVNDLIHHRAPAPELNVKGRITGGLVAGGARRATRVAVSAAQTKTDLIDLTGRSADAIDVIPYGVAPPDVAPMPERAMRELFGLGDRPLILSPSARQPHKNIPRLLEAHAQLQEPRPLLVLPGYATAHDGPLQTKTRELGIEHDVRWLGWVQQDELEALFAAARLLVFPSLYEGFGLPVLEAMLRGVPVACSDRGSLAEIAGDAALIFDPEDPAAIAAAMQRLTTTPGLREQLIAAGREQAAGFTWRACAEGYVESYRRTLSAAGSGV